MRVPGGEVEQAEGSEGDHTGHGGGSVHVYAGEQARHLTLPSSHHEQAGGRQQGAVDSSKGGARHEHGHDPGHTPV